MNILNKLRGSPRTLHTVAVIVSAILSSLVASDPAIGAAIGTICNGAVASLSLS